jgi:hypothetical protein
LTDNLRVPNLSRTDMSKISLRRLLGKLTALALSTTAVPLAIAQTNVPTVPLRDTDTDTDPDPDQTWREPIAGDEDDELDPTLALDLAYIDPSDAAVALGRGLALALNKMRPLGATHIASTWALSNDNVRRLAVAHALEWVFPLVGHGVVIDHLARDSNPEIRVAAARAAWARRAIGGDQGVLERLSDDPNPDVRVIAAAARTSR